MHLLLADLRYAARMLWRSPGFTAVAVGTLALGIGANTAIFSIIHAVLLAPLPFERPDRIVMLWANPDGQRVRGGGASPADFLDWREQSTSFEGLAAMSFTQLTLTGLGDAARLPGARVSANFFDIMRVKPAMGRTFTADEDRGGGPRAIVLSHAMWQERFGGDPQVLDRTLVLDGVPHPVVGVMPEGFDFPRSTRRRVGFWVPFRIELANPSRGAHSFPVVGRLRDGVTPGAAQAEMDAITTRLQQQYPETNTNWGVDLFSLDESIVGDSRAPLLALLGAVGFVLLIACANVANLLLARATARGRELAVRAALGAGWWRLLQQLLAESLLLSAVGAALGILLAAWGLELASPMIASWVPRAWEVRLDLPVLLFTGALSVVTGLLFGLAPALHVSRAAVADALKSAGRGTVSPSHRRLRAAFVVSEVALAFVLLIGAGLLIRSFYHLQHVQPGFEQEATITSVLSLPSSRYDTLAKQHALLTPLLERVRQMPDVRRAAAASFIPLDDKETMLIFSVEGEPAPPLDRRRLAQWRIVSDGFFETLGIPLLRGRGFTAADTEGAPRVAVISRALADKYFPGKDPLGHRVTIDDIGPDAEWFTVAGVVDDVRFRSLTEPAMPVLYYPAGQQQFPEFTLVARTSGDPAAIVPSLRGIVAGLDPQMALADVRTMEEVVAGATAGARFRTALLGAFAALALLLSAIGVYGVMSYSVEQRTREMGLRMALGAREAHVLRLVAGHGLRLAAAGIAFGLLAAWWLVRVLDSMLVGVSAEDPATFAAIAVILIAVAGLASYVPARRAARTDPMVVLRME